MQRTALGVLAVLVGISLVAAPVTMGDWGEQAVIEAEPVGSPTSQTENAEPVQFEALSPTAQSVVRSAIESGEQQLVYGYDDAPDRFAYSDYDDVSVVIYEGERYEVTTWGTGGFPVVYWLYQLPFVVLGLVAAAIGANVVWGRYATSAAGVVAAVGVGAHLLGPEFDFPLLDPIPFVGLGVTAAVGGVALLVHEERTSEAAPTRTE